MNPENIFGIIEYLFFGIIYKISIDARCNSLQQYYAVKSTIGELSKVGASRSPSKRRQTCAGSGREKAFITRYTLLS